MRSSNSAGAPLLSIEGLRIRFGGVVALNGVDVIVRKGTVTALIGPNGAGKTTLFNIITGVYRPEGGSVTLDGTPLLGLPSHQRARLGIARTFQALKLVPDLTVLENVAVGAARYMRGGAFGAMLRLPSSRRSEDEVIRHSARILTLLGLAPIMHEMTASQPYGIQRRVEIARALTLGPRVLLLDEPTAGMGPEETDEVASLLAIVRDTFGVAVFVVEHDMTFVRGISDYIYVIDFGVKIAEGTVEAVVDDPAVRTAYLGHHA